MPLADSLRRAVPIAAIAWTGLTLVLLLMPGSGAPTFLFPYADKLVHAVLFGTGTGLWLLAWPRAIVAVLVGAVLLAVGTEVAQGAIGWGRSAELGDALADIAGAVLGALAARWVAKRRVARANAEQRA